MTEESAILRAYGLATQGKTEEAERLLGSVKTTAAKDLLARIRFDSGDEAAAKRLWEEVLEENPDHAGAKAALACIGKSREVVDEACWRFRWTFLSLLVGVAVVFLFAGALVGRDWKSANNQPTIPTETPQTTLPSPTTSPNPELQFTLPMSNADFLAQKAAFWDSVPPGAKVVLSGGPNGEAPLRQRRLAVVADLLVEEYQATTWDQLLLDLTPKEDGAYHLQILPAHTVTQKQ